jgi:hypothetical protein
VTAQDLIYIAFRAIGRLRGGQVANSQDLDDGLRMLNALVDSWNAEELSIFTKSRTTFALAAGQASYTLGTGGDWNVPRPPRIDAAQRPDGGEIRILTDGERRRQRPEPGSIVWAIHDEASWPRRTITVYPTPNAAGQIILEYPQALTAFADLNSTQYTFPPGYEMALQWSLAEMLWPLYVDPQSKNQSVTLPQVQEFAREFKRKVRVQNHRPALLECDPALVPGGYDILTHEGV